MKKLIATITMFAALSANLIYGDYEIVSATKETLCNFSGHAQIGIESEDIEYGKKIGKSATSTSVELSVPLWYGDIYAGIKGTFPTNPSSDVSGLGRPDAGNRVEYKAGYMANIFCLPMPYDFYVEYVQLSVDAGHKYRSWLQKNHTNPFNNVNRDNTTYVGILTDAFLHPSVYYKYNWNLEQHVVEVALNYTCPLEFFGICDLALDANANIGWLHANKYDGDQIEFETGTIHQHHHNSYAYANASLDLVYTVNDCVELRAGVRWAGNNDGKQNDSSSNLGGTENRLFWGSSLAFSF